MWCSMEVRLIGAARGIKRKAAHLQAQWKVGVVSTWQSSAQVSHSTFAGRPSR